MTKDVNSLIDGVGRAVEEMRAKLDAGLKDVVDKEHVERLNASIGEHTKAIDEINAKLALKDMSPTDTHDNDTPEMKVFKADFNRYIITGAGEKDIMRSHYQTGGVMAAMSVGSDSDGGFTAPIEWDRTITDQLAPVVPMRQFASSQTVKGRGFKRLYNLHGASSGWVGETDARSETNTPTLAEYEYAFGEVYANPAVTQHILEDSEINITAYLSGEVALEFAQQEGLAFLSGDGVNKPKGVLKYTAADEAAAPKKHPLGHIEEVKSGNANSLTADGLIDLVYSVPTARLTNKSSLYMSRATHAILRKMKDGDGNYLWQPPFQAGQPAQVLGFAVRELDGMPDVAANAVPIIFGDMEQGYKIFDRVGTQVLRDDYTKKPYVLFYTRKRVGGGLWNPEFLRYHRVEA